MTIAISLLAPMKAVAIALNRQRAMANLDTMRSGGAGCASQNHMTLPRCLKRKST